MSILALAPIWSVRYLPTADGPSHLYNAWLMREILRGNALVERWFVIQWLPYPNWSSHALLVMLMTVMPPLIAEKVLVSGIVLLFLYAMWQWSGVAENSGRECAFFALPFAYNMLLQAGFYNFAIGFALQAIAIAFFWQRRDRPDAKTIGGVALLLVACYFSHPMPAAIAAASIGFLWLATIRGRPFRAHVRHLAAFVPLVPLFAWFAWTQRGGSVAASGRALGGLAQYITHMSVLATFDAWQYTLGRVMFAILTVLIVITLVRRRWRWSEGDAFVVLTVAIIALFFNAPAGAFGGGMLMERMALFVALSPLAWIAPRLPRRVMIVVVVVFASLSLCYTFYLVRRYRGVEKRIEEFLAGSAAMGERTAVLSLVNGVRPAKGTFIPVFAHAFDYAAMEKGDVDLSNYEAAIGYFPIRYRADPCARYVDLTTPVDLAPYAQCAEYIFTWNVSEESPLLQGLTKSYVIVGGTDQGRVYKAP